MICPPPTNAVSPYIQKSLIIIPITDLDIKATMQTQLGDLPNDAL